MPGQAEPSEPVREEPIEVARGEAFRGPWRMNRSDFRYVDDPTVAILFARSEDGGQSFNEPIHLSRSTADAGKRRLSRDYWRNGSLDLTRAADGTLYAAWTEYEGRLRFSRSIDDGESFAAPQLLAGAKDELPARAPSLALDRAGRLHLLWERFPDPGERARGLARSHAEQSAEGELAFARPRVVPGTGERSRASMAAYRACSCASWQ